MYDADKSANILKLVSLSLINNAGYIDDKSGNPMLYKRELGAESIVYTLNAREITSDLVIFNLDRLIDSIMYTPQSKNVFFYFLITGEKMLVEEFKHALSDKFDECYERGLLCEAIFVDSDNLSYSTMTGRKPIDRKLRKALERSLDNLKSSSIDDTLDKQKREYVQMQSELRPLAKVGLFNVAFVLILVNLFIFLVDGYIYFKSGVMPLTELGIQNNELIRNGETWRLVTSMFLHADIAHLAGNMLSLYYFGNIILPHLPKKKFLVLYFVSGLSGNILSYFFTTYLSLGASGCIMGLGGFLIYAMFFSKKGYLFRRRGNYFIFAYMIAFNLLYGLFVEGIDNYGHFGGFFAGLVIAWIYSRSNKEKTSA